MKTALVVFARAPRPGAVKTRLIPVLGTTGAARLYERLLRRALEIAAAAPVATRIIALDVAAAQGWFAGRAAFDISVQVAGTLGERMAAACAKALATHDAVLLMGSDLADISPADLTLAARWLASDAEVVLGPVADGGYWLIGMREARADLFADIAWGSPGVYAATVAHLAATLTPWRALPLRHDVDVPADLVRILERDEQRL